MKTYSEIDKDDLKDLLNSNWMTHDAMWVSHCIKEIGMEKTNLVNKAAVRSMAKVEAKSLKKLLGIKKISSYQEIINFMLTGFEIIKGPFMKFEMEFPGENIFLWKIPRCFAYEGMKRVGVIDQYECGIVERVYGWFEELEIKYTVESDSKGCNMHEYGKCETRFIFNFEELNQ